MMIGEFFKLLQTKFDIWALALTAAAIPSWVFLLLLIPGGPGFGSGIYSYFVAPIVLCGTTAAIHRLLRRYKNALPLSALIAGYGMIAALSAAAALSGN